MFKQDSAAVIDLLTCPEQGSSLEIKAGRLHSKNGISFPETAGIPWLFKDPEASLLEWRANSRAYIQQLHGAVQNMKLAQKGKALSEPARRRLAKRLQASVEQIKHVESILEPLQVESAGSAELSGVLGAQLPNTQGISSYYDNIHRDWGWDDEISGQENENSIAIEIILEVLGNTDANSLIGKDALFLGAGACRLSWDLHQRLKFSRTINIDVNPLMLLAGEKITSGKTVKLFEFPIAPVDEENSAVLRRLKAPGKHKTEPENSTKDESSFFCLFADGTNPPIKSGSLDLVVTPWFIDIIPQDIHEFFPRINALLKPGGLWVNFGSNAFLGADYARRYSLEEVFLAARSSGFKVERHLRKKIPYMCSPASAHGRRELVTAFVAKKESEVKVSKPTSWMPAWLVDHSLPVPISTDIVAATQTHTIYAGILSLVDGNRSLQTLAVEVAARYGLQPAEAEVSLAKMLKKIFEDQRQGALT